MEAAAKGRERGTQSGVLSADCMAAMRSVFAYHAKPHPIVTYNGGE